MPSHRQVASPGGYSQWSAAHRLARSRSAGVLGAAMSAVVLIAAVLPRGPVDVPLREMVVVEILPLLPALVCLAVPFTLASPMPELETAAPRSVALLRAAMASTVFGAAALTTLLMAWAARLPDEILALERNQAALLGVCLLASAVASVGVSWAVVPAIVIVTFLFGSNPDGAARWALLLQPPFSLPAGLIGFGLAALGMVVHVAFGAVPLGSAED